MQLPAIPPLDEAAQASVIARQETLVKPKGALGELETLSVRLAGMTGRLDWLPRRKTVIVCAGDHGVVAQGVSTVPQAVTALMVGHFLKGTAAISVLARQMDCPPTSLAFCRAESVFLTRHWKGIRRCRS